MSDGVHAKRAALTLGLIGLVGMVVAACGATDAVNEAQEQEPAPAPINLSADGDETEARLVVVTTSILGDIVGNLLGDDAVVEVLMPAGVDPHAYQPSAADGALLRRADIVIANGLQLESNLTAVLEAVETEGGNVYAFAEAMDPLEFGGHGHDDDGHGHDDDGHGHEEDGHGYDEDDHGHEHGPLDPHVWFDPLRMIDGVEHLAAALAAHLPSIDAAEVSARADAYAEELRDVHAELEEMFAGLPDERRVLVTNHDSFAYLADRYQFRIVGTVIPGSSTQAETDPRSFATLIETVERFDVPAIFTENVDNSRLAEQLAREVASRGGQQIEVVELYTDALGGPDSDAETYLDLLRTTGARITTALS